MTPIDGRAPIAEEHVIWVMPSGERRAGRIAICAPEPFRSHEVDNDTTWACWWFMEGLWHRPCPSLGDGSLQPLLLALQTIGCELRAFISRGGKIFEPESDKDQTASALISLRFLMLPSGTKPPADPVLAEIDAELAHRDG